MIVELKLKVTVGGTIVITQFFLPIVSKCVKKQLFAYFFRLSLGFPTFSSSIPRSFGHFSVSTWTPSWQNNPQTRKYYYKNHSKKVCFSNHTIRVWVICFNSILHEVQHTWRKQCELYKALKMPSFVERTEQYPLIIPMSGYWFTLQPNLWSGKESKQNRITNSSQPWPSKNKLGIKSSIWFWIVFFLFAGGIPFHSSKFSTTTFELMVSGHWTTSIFNLGHP